MGIFKKIIQQQTIKLSYLRKEEKTIKMNTLKIAVFALVVATACARPQNFDNFQLIDDDDADNAGNFNAEVVQRLAEQDLYDLNPSYTYSYQVADEDQQTYIKQTESRDSNVVTGEYSYVDPLGSLITVKYTADENGYQETRPSEPNFVAIRNAPLPEPNPVAPAPKPARPAAKPQTNDDLIAKIISQLTPFIKTTVSNSLG